MKPLINYLLIALAFIGSACNDSETDPFAPHASSADIDFQATLTVEQVYGYHPQPHTEDRAILVFEGSGECPQIPSFTMQIVHAEYYQQDLLNIESGRFHLQGSSGEELYGVYTGIASMNGSQMNIYQEWSVVGGEGKFRGAGGVLTAEMESANAGLRQFSVRLSGTVNL